VWPTLCCVHYSQFERVNLIRLLITYTRIKNAVALSFGNWTALFSDSDIRKYDSYLTLTASRMWM